MVEGNRLSPEFMLKRSTLDWVQEGVAFAALISVVVICLVNQTDMPAQVPTHFGFSGRPDAWGPKSRLLLLPLVAIGLFIVLTVASHIQSFINLPITVDRDSPEVQRLLRSMSITLKMVVLLTFACIEWSQVQTALGLASGLGRLFLPMALAAVFLPLGIYLRLLGKYRQ